MKTDIKSFKSRKELERFAEDLMATNRVITNEIEDLREKLTHCEQMLKQAQEIPNLEEGLLLREIGVLDTMSKQAGLDLNETKQLKMLIDSLVALRRQKGGQEPDNKRKPKLPNDPSKLISIVKNSEGEG